MGAIIPTIITIPHQRKKNAGSGYRIYAMRMETQKVFYIALIITFISLYLFLPIYPSLWILIGSPNYDKTTVYVPQDFFSNGKLSPTQKQYWALKQVNYDVVIFFQQGSFLNVFERDADICNKYLGLEYTHGNKKVNLYTAGIFIESFEKHSARLLSLGFKVARVLQTNSNSNSNTSESNSTSSKKSAATKQKKETEDRMVERYIEHLSIYPSTILLTCM